MDTQNTPIHLRLWHRGFWLLTFASMLLSMSATILMAAVPLWMAQTMHFDLADVALVTAAFAAGTWLLGPFCSFLIQHYRRNHVFELSVLALQLSLLAFYLTHRYLPGYLSVALPVVALLCGAFWGLAEMILSSTLIVDVCESFQRTEANHATAWFRRFSLSLGPVVSLLVYHYVGFWPAIIASAAAACLAIVFVSLVDFPFKAPDDNLSLFSCDRYLLCEGHLMMVTLLLMTLVLGMMLATVTDVWFYATLMLGFLLAILAEKFAFANADLESETLTGLICVGAALLLMLTRESSVTARIVPTLIGFGFGIIGSRFMLFFIKLSHHCQRGTSQSTFLLTWTTGITLGLAAGYGLLQCLSRQELLAAALGLIVVSLCLYHFVTHPWYMRNKSR